MSQPALLLLFSVLHAPPLAETKVFRAGTSVVDIAPEKFPVRVNAMFTERSADRVIDPLTTRSLVIDDGATRIAFAIVDTCMMSRELIDEAKALAAAASGIAPERMLVAATHTHSAPSAMSCLGSREDPDYRQLLPGRIARGIIDAALHLEPARVGWGTTRAAGFTFNRRWIRRPDRIGTDPFGDATVRANMHPGHESPDAIGPSGPVDDELSLLSLESTTGRPVAILANFSMHYYESALLSSDYFGRFHQHLSRLLGANNPGMGERPFVAMMSQGTSGDLMWMDYSRPRQQIGHDAYAEALAKLAHQARSRIQHRDHVDISMREETLRINRRLPGAERLAWARGAVKALQGNLPTSLPDIYAHEQIYLHEEPTRELKLQAIRIGELGITAMPNEVFAITGLKIKAQSPLRPTFNIELANGSDGYIPPPEQHRLGGYTTWPARTAGLEVTAEPRLVEGVLHLLEAVAGKPRLELRQPSGPLAQAILARKPFAYWRLSEPGGPAAADASGNGRAATFVGNVAFWLDGPHPGEFSGTPGNYCVHLAGGHIGARADGLGTAYRVEFWFWNGLPTEARGVTAHLFSRCGPGSDPGPGDHLGLGGKDGAAGKLFFSTGAAGDRQLVGRTVLENKLWYRIVFVREQKNVAVYLDDHSEPEIQGATNEPLSAQANEIHLGGRPGSPETLEGKLDEVALFAGDGPGSR